MNWIKVTILSLCFFKAAISEINVRNFYHNQNQKIVDGEDAKQGQFPYQVMIIPNLKRLKSNKYLPN